MCEVRCDSSFKYQQQQPILTMHFEIHAVSRVAVLAKYVTTPAFEGHQLNSVRYTVLE